MNTTLFLTIYFLVPALFLLTILILDVRIKGANYRTNWEDAFPMLIVFLFWPFCLALLAFGGSIMLISMGISKLNLAANFDKLLIKLFAKK